MDPFSRRPLGKTAISLPALGFGGSEIGNLHRPVPEEEALAAIAAAYDGGIRYFDTAPLYGGGLGEHRMGHVLRRHRRADYVLSTKVGRLQVPRDWRQAPGWHSLDALPFELVHDYGHDGVLRSLEHSLLRLGLDRVDIALIHDVDPYNHGEVEQKRLFRIAMDGAYPALMKLRGEGLLGAVGVGVNDWRVCQEFAEAGDFDCFLLAGRYTLLEQGALPFLDFCSARGIGVILGAPFNSGILARGPIAGTQHNYQTPSTELLDRVRRLSELCARHVVSLPAAALQFPLGHPAIVSVLPGPRSAAQVPQCLAWMSEAIPASLWAAMKADGLLDSAVPVPIDQR